MDLFGPEPGDDGGQEASLEGVIDRIVFESPDSGFYVARLKEAHRPVVTTVVGAGLAVSPGESVRLWGEWVDDKKWGRQLKVARFEVLQPSTTEGIERFLGSGLIKGVGPKAAERIVAVFGVDTLRVIAEEPERLREVPGVGKKTAQRITDGYEAHRAIQSIMVFLQGHGVSAAQAMRIYKQFGDRSVALLRENPYRLAGEVSGIAFKTADAIAHQMGIATDAPDRLAAGMLHVLREAAGHGNTFLPKADVLARAAELLDVAEGALTAPLDTMVTDGRVVADGERVFPPDLDRAERSVAALFAGLAKAPRKALEIAAADAIAWVESHRTISLSSEQRDAVHSAVEQPLLVITGGPGTGKTTIINSLLALFDRKAYGVVLAAPTGRAAKRMEQATGREAHTIHRLLGFRPGGGFVRNANYPLDLDVLIVDEVSMVDIVLMEALLQAVPPSARLILVGDVDQLPSVGPGNVLMDIIASLAVPTIRLEQVFRQAGESGIVENAHRINRGQEPNFNTADFFFVDRPDPQRALETIIELVTVRIPRKFGLDPIRDIQVLSPMHRGAAGVAALNEALQSALNPDGTPLPKKGLRTGDKVMQLRNNYDLDVYNGDVGVIAKAEPELEEVYIRFDDRTVLYHFDDLDEVALAYAATVHKSQGSEYPAVVMPLLAQHFVMLQRNVFYTAVTRARRMAVLVGEHRAVQRAVRTVDAAARHTALADRLRASMPAAAHRAIPEGDS